MVNNKMVLGAVISLLLLFSCTNSGGDTAYATTTAAPGDVEERVAVIELFTSEGCSSCPPADALLPMLQKQYGKRLIALSFHVDYWNRLGWKDPFSSADYTARQNTYAAAFNADNIYTPQAIINGSVGMNGSNKSRLTSAIDNALQRTGQPQLTATATLSTGTCHVEYTTTLAANETVAIALVQLEATTDVKRGENSGRTLKHHNVVRVYQNTQGNSGTADLTMPMGLEAADCHVVVLVQNNTSRHITNATEIAITP